MAQDLAATLLQLHIPGSPLIIPNPWDAGSAKLLQWLGFAALATTSSGLASTFGRLDGAVTKDETLGHAAEIAAAVTVPVTADLVNGFAEDPADVAKTVTDACATGLAGCSIEDFTGDEDAPIYDFALAVERVAAAAQAAHGGPAKLVLTARSENYLHGAPRLQETISRLQAFQEAGADVLYAPGITATADISAIVGAVDLPINVLLMPGGPKVAEVADLGVSRISVGGAFAYTAIDALVKAGRELLDEGTTEFLERSAQGRLAARQAFRS